MIKTDEYQRVCRLAKLIEVSNSKTNMFKTIDQMECIELIAGKIIPSQIITMKDGTKEKAVNEKPKSKDIIAVLGVFEKDMRAIEEPEGPKNGRIPPPPKKIHKVMEAK